MSPSLTLTHTVSPSLSNTCPHTHVHCTVCPICWQIRICQQFRIYRQTGESQGNPGIAQGNPGFAQGNPGFARFPDLTLTYIRLSGENKRTHNHFTCTCYEERARHKIEYTYSVEISLKGKEKYFSIYRLQDVLYSFCPWGALSSCPFGQCTGQSTGQCTEYHALQCTVLRAQKAY